MGGCSSAGLLHDRLMQVGIERLTLSLDLADAVAAQPVQQLFLHESHALSQRSVVASLLGGLQGPVQVVQGREQVLGEREVGVAPLFGPVLGGPLLIVLEVRLRLGGQF